MQSRSLDAVLAERNLLEYKDVLVKNGLTMLADLRGVTDADLASIGIDKLFHRKRLLQIAADEEARHHSHGAAAGVADSVSADGGGTGDHIRIDVLGARGIDGEPLSERDYYVRVSVCGRDGAELPQEEPQRTPRAVGPLPIWPVTPTSALNIRTTFRQEWIVIELKERRLLTANRVVGVVVLSPEYFARFTSGHVEDAWHVLHELPDDRSDATACLHLLVSVPGGCPIGNGPAYHVVRALMTHRKLRVVVFDALLLPRDESADQPASASAGRNDGAAVPPSPDLYDDSEPPPPTSQDSLPNMYVTLNLDSVGHETDETHLKRKTRVVPHSTNPTFDRFFDFTADVGKCKLLTLKLKRESGAVVTSHETIGTVRMPIQFMLARVEPTTIDDAFAVLDDAGHTVARMHVRLQTMSVTPAEPGSPRKGFHRTDSTSSHLSDTVDFGSHPIFSASADVLPVSSDDNPE